MSDQNAIQVAIDKKAVSKELLNSVVSQLLPALESALSATIVNSISLQLTTLANSPTISKKDFAAINGISSAVLEKWIANGVVLLAPTPSTTITQQRKNRKTGQMQTVVMERHGNALINLEAWREKNRQQAIKCRYINVESDYSNSQGLTMFDYRVSKHTHFDDACKAFVNRHNLTELAALMGTKPQILRNKFNPEQPHKLTCEEVLLITDLTEDATLLDGMLAQINCLPSVPVNEIATSNLSTYALQATAAVGSIAADAVKGGTVSSQRRMSLLEGVNAGIRHLSLIGLVVQGRVQASPALASAVGAIASVTTNGLM